MHDDDAERALIGAALTWAEALEQVCALPVAAWYRDEARWCVEAMIALRGRGEPVDAITVRAEVRRRGVWHAELGAYMRDGMRDVPTLQVVPTYARIVLECAEHRGAVRAAAEQLAHLGAPVNVLDVAGNPLPLYAPPPGYEVEHGAIWRLPLDEDAPRVRVLPCVVRIIRRAVDVVQGTHVVTLAWIADGREHEITVDRVHIAESRRLVALASSGLPVTSTTAGEVVRYLAAHEEACGISLTLASRVCGWQGPGRSAYLRGTHRHGTRCPEWMRGDPGLDPVIDAVREAGDVERWREVVGDVCRRHDVVRLAVACSAAPALLHLLRAPGWCLDIASASSRGKTSTLRVAASVWGDPAVLVRGWDTTRVGVERLAGALCSLPVALDDTQRAAKPDVPVQVVYDITSGVGRSRGSITGMQASARYETVILSTGEGPLAGRSAHAGGARARTMIVEGSPWGAESLAVAERIRATLATVADHHGHAGRLLVERLLTLSGDDVAALRARWHELVTRYAAQAAAWHGPQPATDRLAQYAATAQIAGELLAEAAGLPELEWVSAALWRDISRAAADVDRARAALVHAWTWLQSNPARVLGQEDGDPSSGYIGADAMTGADGRVVGWLQPTLEAELQRAGYDVGATLSAWSERGWLSPSGEAHRRTVRVTVKSSRWRLLRLTGAGLEVADGADAGERVSLVEDVDEV